MIYLDNAATSYPKPESVYSRVDHILREVGGNPGRSSHRLALEASRVVFDARESAARLINAPDSSRIAFTKNATEAVNAGLKGFPLKPGDHIVTTTFEHNSVVKAMAALEGRGMKVTRVRPDALGFLKVKEIERAFTKKTRLLCLSHASNVFGTIQPLKEIGDLCKRKGVLLMVDAAQSAGAVPVDVRKMNIAILAATGHKALFGPQGTGFIYIREGIEVTPLIDGGTGESSDRVPMPERLEAGTLNTPGIGGLGAGVEFVLKEGVEKIRAHEVELTGRILSGLKGVPGISVIGTDRADERVALVSFNIEGVSPIDAGVRLDSEFSIMARCGTHCAPSAHREAGTFPEGAVRVSPGYFNRHSDIDDLLRAVRAIVGGGK